MKHFRPTTILTFAASTLLCVGLTRADEIKSFVDQRCMDCHDASTKEGGFSIEQMFDTSIDASVRMELASHVIGRVERGEMPPEEEKEFFQSDETKEFIRSLDKTLLTYFNEQKKSGLGHMRRLKSSQYVNTLNDLLGYPLRNIEAILPTDDKGAIDPAEVTDFHLARYVRSAERALDYVLYRELGEAQTLALTPDNILKVNSYFRVQVAKASKDNNALLDPQKGLLIIGNRFGRFSQYAEAFSPRIRKAGLYQVRVRVIAFRDPTDFRIAARSSPPTSGQLSGLIGSRPVYFGHAKAGEPNEVEIKAFFDAGDKVAVQKTSSTRGAGRYAGKHWKSGHQTGLWVPLVEVTGPLNEEIISTRRALLGDHPANREGAAKVLADFLPRAFRGPTTPDEVAPFLAIYDRDLTRSEEHIHALREALKAVLTSPRVLYRNGGSGTLNDYEIATRLSYFLWSTMPDETLFSLAAEGQLSNPAVRSAQVDRMLADKRSERFVREFTNYWLQLHRVGETKPAFRTRPIYNEVLEEDIRTETRVFFREVLDEDLDVANFLDSDWAMLNENMATLYGLTDRDVSGSQFRRVALKPEDSRGGLLAQSSFACLTSNGSETQPILRGVWILKNLLNQPLEPPKNVEPIETDARGATSILEQIRLHRDAAACRSCHQKIDPLGIALENYGVIGNWREKYRSDLPIETSVKEYSNLSGMSGVKKFLLEQQDEFRVQLINKLKEYALGREITYYDLTDSRRIAAKHRGLRELTKQIVASETFTVR